MTLGRMSTRSAGPKLGFAVATLIGLGSQQGYAATPMAGADLNANRPAAQAQDSALRYQPVVGQQRSYVLTSRGKASVNMTAIAAQMSPSGKDTRGSMQEHLFEVEATVGTRVLAHVNGEWLVAMRLDAPRYVVDGMADDRAAHFETTFLAHVSEQGAILSLEFPVQFPQEAVFAIRALVEPMQVVLGNVVGNAWQVNEKTVNGSAIVNYRVDAIDNTVGVARLSRTVSAAQRVLPGMTDAQDRANMKATVDASSGTIEWALDGSGVRSMTIREATSSYSGSRKVTSSDLTFTARMATSQVSGLPTTVAAAREALADTKYGRAAFYRVPAQFEAELAAVDFEMARTAFIQRVNASPSEMVLMLRFYVRKHPSSATDFVNAFEEVARSGETEITANIVGYGLASLAAAGHTEAQRAIVDVIGNNAFTALTQRKALDSLLSLEMPERFVPTAVWNFRQSLPQSGANVSLEGLSIATNVYGTMGSVSMGVKENTEEVVANLGRILRTGDALEKRRALTAFGNVGDPSLSLPHTEKYFTNSDENVRIRSFDSFRNAVGEEHFRKFASLYANERNLWVLRDASEIALTMSDSPTRNAWAVETARASDDLVTRSRAISVLGRGLKSFPGNEEALRGLLEVIKDREARRMIYSFVAPKARGAK